MRFLAPRRPLGVTLTMLTLAAGGALAIGASTPALASGSTTTWTKLASTGPSGRAGAAMAYDPATGQTVLFGGFDGTNYLGSGTWFWNGSAWSEVTSGTQPTPRGWAMMAYDASSGQLVLFGGQNQPGCDAGGFLGDTWIWNGSGWTHANPAASPSPRAFAAMAYDPAEGGVVLFGGQSAATGTTCPTNGSLPPSSDAISYSGTWLWNGSTWTREAATGPSARYGAAMSYDPANRDLVLFGGTSGAYGAGPGMSDTWLWNGTSWAQDASASGPSARFGAAMHYDPAISQPVMFGGSSSDGYTGATTPVGTWEFNGSTWVKAAPTYVPQSRFSPAMTYDATSEQLLMFGGQNFSNGTMPTNTLGYQTPPGAPTSVSAVAGNNSATVDWTAPPNGGSSLTSYTVTPSPSCTGCTGLTVSGSPPATSTTVNGLTNGQAYTFTVSATNAMGTGPASAAAGPVTPSAPAASSPSPSPSPSASASPSPSPSASPSKPAPTSTASPTAKSTTVAVTGANGALWYRTPGTPWRSLGGRLIGAPAVVTVSSARGQLSQLFVATGLDHAIWVRTLAQGWRRLSDPGYCLSGPGASVSGPSGTQTLTVACAGGNHAVWYTQPSLANFANPQGWRSLGGVVTSAPAIAGINGQLRVFATGTDGHAWTRTQSVGWLRTPWVCSGHEAVAAAGGSAYFGCDTTSGALWIDQLNARGWQPPVDLGGKLIAGPGIAVASSGPVFYVEGANRGAWMRTLSTGWTSLGGVLEHGAAATGE